MKVEQGREGEMQVPRWIDNWIIEQSARLHHKFDNTRGRDYARVGSMELDVTEIPEEHARGRDHV